MEAVIVMRVHLLVYCLFTAVCAHDGSPAVMCEPTSKMSTTAAAPLSIPVNSDVFLSESIAIVQERRAVDFNTRQKKARSQSSSAPCYIFFCSLLYPPLLLAISSSAPCYIFICSLLYLPLPLAISSSASCYIFICSLLYFPLRLAVSSSAPYYIFICSLLYLHLLLAIYLLLLLAIPSSAPCYIFFCSLIYLPLLLAIFAFVPFTLKRRAYVKKELLTLYFSQDNVKHLNRESVHLLETTALVIAAVHYFCLSSLILC